MTQAIANLTVVPFVVATKHEKSESSVPFGHRLVTVSWKETEKKKEAGIKNRAACCVAIPTVTVEVLPECLAAALNEAVAEMQDKIVAEAVNKALSEKNDILWADIQITEDMVNAQGIADWTIAQAEKGRLSKESIGNWFDTMLRKPLEIALADIPGINDDILTQSLEDHKKNLLTLASPRANMPEKLVKQLQRAIKLVGSDDKVKSGLNARLQSFIKPPAAEMSFALPDVD